MTESFVSDKLALFEWSDKHPLNLAFSLETALFWIAELGDTFEFSVLKWTSPDSRPGASFACVSGDGGW